MNRYTASALIERIKRELASKIIDDKRYREEIVRQKKSRTQENKCLYDYDLDLDFSVEPKMLDDRKYYYIGNLLIEVVCLWNKFESLFKDFGWLCQFPDSCIHPCTIDGNIGCQCISIDPQLMYH